MSDILTNELRDALIKVAKDTNDRAELLLKAKTPAKALAEALIKFQSEQTASAIASYVGKKILNSMQTNSLQIKKV